VGKVIFDINVSLDVFMTAANRRPEEPMGDGGLRLVERVLGDDERPVSQRPRQDARRRRLHLRYGRHRVRPREGPRERRPQGRHTRPPVAASLSPDAAQTLDEARGSSPEVREMHRTLMLADGAEQLNRPSGRFPGYEVLAHSGPNPVQIAWLGHAALTRS
jgi:hypothetical protein